MCLEEFLMYDSFEKKFITVCYHEAICFVCMETMVMRRSVVEGPTMRLAHKTGV
jgi:hypothetical protein